MWDPEEFERHWQAEFPGEQAPLMRLESVLDMERELERCKLNLKRLQQVLAEEKFKVSYLETALAGEKLDQGRRSAEGGEGGSGGPSAKEPVPAGQEKSAAGGGGDARDPDTPDREVAGKAEPNPYLCLDLPPEPPVAEGGGAVLSLTAAIHRQLLQPRLLFRPGEDCASPGRDSPVSHVPGEELSLGTGAGRGSEEGEPNVSGGDDGGDSSDHDFEMVDLNEKFVLSHLVVAPYRFGARDEAEKPGRASSPHRWMHLIPGCRRQRHPSRDLELEAETKEGRASLQAEDEPPRRGAREHFPYWRRKRFLCVPERDSPSHSSPERGSDCSRNSSDPEDGSSAGSHFIAQTGLKLATILLPQPHKCSDNRRVPPH